MDSTHWVTPIQEVLDSLYEFPDRSWTKDEDKDQWLTRYWGFTIYRTFYGPGSDSRWMELLETINTSTQDRLKEMPGGEDTIITTKVYGRFKSDPRSDPNLLDGLTMEDVRKIYLEGTGGRPMNVDNQPWRLFLLADEEVLVDEGLCILKVAAADYDAIAAVVPKNPRFTKRYFGWMTMPSTTVLNLWVNLYSQFFESVANGTNGAPTFFWNPEDTRCTCTSFYCNCRYPFGSHAFNRWRT